MTHMDIVINELTGCILYYKCAYSITLTYSVSLHISISNYISTLPENLTILFNSSRLNKGRKVRGIYILTKYKIVLLTSIYIYI